MISAVLPIITLPPWGKLKTTLLSAEGGKREAVSRWLPHGRLVVCRRRLEREGEKLPKRRRTHRKEKERAAGRPTHFCGKELGRENALWDLSHVAIRHLSPSVCRASEDTPFEILLDEIACGPFVNGQIGGQKESSCYHSESMKRMGARSD